jgi:hypothetical protein
MFIVPYKCAFLETEEGEVTKSKALKYDYEFKTFQKNRLAFILLIFKREFNCLPYVIKTTKYGSLRYGGFAFCSLFSYHNFELPF